MLKKRTFLHQNIPYSFNWNITHHKEKISHLGGRREEYIRLGTYFKRIYKGDIPNNLFNSKNLPRVSQFKIRGIKPAFLASFSKNLIRSGKIIRYGSNSKLLTPVTSRMFLYYEDLRSIKPDNPLEEKVCALALKRFDRYFKMKVTE